MEGVTVGFPLGALEEGTLVGVATGAREGEATGFNDGFLVGVVEVTVVGAFVGKVDPIIPLLLEAA